MQRCWIGTLIHLLGFGGAFNNRWFFGQWELDYIKKFDPSIEYLELFAVCVAVFAWTEGIVNKWIVLFCNNQSVVAMLNQSSSRCKNCMCLIRKLIFRCLQYNVRVFARWVPGVENQHVDFLSRQKIQLFLDLVKAQNLQVDEYLTLVPPELWPLSKLWIK